MRRWRDGEGRGRILGAFGELLRLLGALLGRTWGGLSRLASRASALLGVLGGEMLQNVAVAKERLTFLKQCCCGQRSGGVPSPFGGREAS